MSSFPVTAGPPPANRTAPLNTSSKSPARNPPWTRPSGPSLHLLISNSPTITSCPLSSFSILTLIGGARGFLSPLNRLLSLASIVKRSFVKSSISFSSISYHLSRTDSSKDSLAASTCLIAFSIISFVGADLCIFSNRSLTRSANRIPVFLSFSDIFVCLSFISVHQNFRFSLNQTQNLT